jgi:hypothetical protein
LLITLTFNGTKVLTAKKDTARSDGVNRLIDDRINDDLFDGVGDGVSVLHCT